MMEHLSTLFYRLLMHACIEYLFYNFYFILINCKFSVRIIGTVSAKIAPRLKCYINASRLNRYNFPTITLSTSYFQHVIVKWCSMKC